MPIHFFTESNLFSQNQSQAYSPVNNEIDPSKANYQYRIFAKLTFSQDAKAYSNVDGFVFIQPQNGNLNSSFLSYIHSCSALDRHANGYEFEKGQKYPEGGKPDRFNLRINPFFRYRPILGIAVAFLIFVMLKGEILKIENLNLYHLAFYCSIGSFFAKTLIERSKAAIKSLKFEI